VNGPALAPLPHVVSLLLLQNMIVGALEATPLLVVMTTASALPAVTTTIPATPARGTAPRLVSVALTMDIPLLTVDIRTTRTIGLPDVDLTNHILPQMDIAAVTSAPRGVEGRQGVDITIMTAVRPTGRHPNPNPPNDNVHGGTPAYPCRFPSSNGAGIGGVYSSSNQEQVLIGLGFWFRIPAACALRDLQVSASTPLQKNHTNWETLFYFYSMRLGLFFPHGSFLVH
jgi:hypothetical protein